MCSVLNTAFQFASTSSLPCTSLWTKASATLLNITPLDPYVRTEKNSNGQCFKSIKFFRVTSCRFYGVMVSTLDSESSDPSSNLGRTWDFELSAKCAQCSTPPSNLHRQVLSLVHGFGQKRLQNVNVTPLDPYVRTEKNSNSQCFESIVFFKKSHPLT